MRHFAAGKIVCFGSNLQGKVRDTATVSITSPFKRQLSLRIVDGPNGQVLRVEVNPSEMGSFLIDLRISVYGPTDRSACTLSASTTTACPSRTRPLSAKFRRNSTSVPCAMPTVVLRKNLQFTGASPSSLLFVFTQSRYTKHKKKKNRRRCGRFPAEALWSEYCTRARYLQISLAGLARVHCIDPVSKLLCRYFCLYISGHRIGEKKM